MEFASDENPTSVRMRRDSNFANKRLDARVFDDTLYIDVYKTISYFLDMDIILGLLSPRVSHLCHVLGRGALIDERD